ncbi:MAG: hypothetical protein V4503_08290 [Gemmatimonadota bacterium]
MRSWATKEVRRLSDGVYQLSSSSIKVDVERHRIAIDSLIVVTDTTANRRRKEPLPVVNLRFRNCALEGIDLDRLTAGRGLQIGRVGCDSVALLAEVPSPPRTTGRRTAADTASFLTLQQDIDLPREIPFVRIDTLTFPQVAISVGISGRSGRRTAVAFDRLLVRLDSLHYDPKEPVSKRSTLLSRDATITLDGFEGSRESATRLSLAHLSANLAHGTVDLNGLIYEPLPGGLSDSLGFTALSVGRLQMRAVDWRAFLTEGDVAVGRLSIDSGSITVPVVGKPDSSSVRATRASRTVAATLRALDRSIQLDTFALHDLRVVETGIAGKTRATTTIGDLALAHLRFDNDSATWASALPVGPVTLLATNIDRRSGYDGLSLQRLEVDLPAATLRADTFHVSPLGNDAAFLGRTRYRQGRTSLDFDHLEVFGIRLPEFLLNGDFLVRRAEVSGLLFDVLSDKGKPKAPGHSRHETPQAALRDLGLRLHADTVTIAGRVRYRERDAAAPKPGVLSFDGIRATVLNLSTDPAKMTDSTPMLLSADARLMGSGALHLEAEIPLLAPTFSMKFHGSVGAMDAEDFNRLIVDATGVRFIRGRIQGVRFSATVTGGVARGSVQPRWSGLGIEVPGVAREQKNLLGKLKRAVAKIAANAFMVRDDNPAEGKPPLNGTINHRWTPAETLPQFVWFGLRDALVPLLKL